MGLCESVMEVLLVSRACKSRPMAVDLATSPEISLPRAYSARSANGVGCEVLARPKYKRGVHPSCYPRSQTRKPGYGASVEHALRTFDRELAKKMYQRRKVVRLKPDQPDRVLRLCLSLSPT